MNPSVTSLPRSSSRYTLAEEVQLEIPLKWKPTKTVSVKPGPAHFRAPRAGWCRERPRRNRLPCGSEPP
jgi:hypothetical protein